MQQQKRCTWQLWKEERALMVLCTTLVFPFLLLHICLSKIFFSPSFLCFSCSRRSFRSFNTLSPLHSFYKRVYPC